MTREEILKTALINALEVFGFNMKSFVESTTEWHSYLQNELFKLALCIISVYGTDQYEYDILNEYAATKAKEIVASGILD